MKSFETWYTELISDELWYSLLRHYKDETIKWNAEKVYAQLVADRMESIRSMKENRKHVYNMTVKNPGDKVAKVDWRQAVAVEKKEEEWRPVSWEKRAEYLSQVQAEIDKIEDRKIRPLFEGEEQVNGQYDLPKPKAKCAPSSPIEVVVEHINKLTAARKKFFLERNPGASEEQVQAYLNKFETI